MDVGRGLWQSDNSRTHLPFTLSHTTCLTQSHTAPPAYSFLCTTPFSPYSPLVPRRIFTGAGGTPSSSGSGHRKYTEFSATTSTYISRQPPTFINFSAGTVPTSRQNTQSRCLATAAGGDGAGGLGPGRPRCWTEGFGGPNPAQQMKLALGWPPRPLRDAKNKRVDGFGAPARDGEGFF